MFRYILTDAAKPNYQTQFSEVLHWKELELRQGFPAPAAFQPAEDAEATLYIPGGGITKMFYDLW